MDLRTRFAQKRRKKMRSGSTLATARVDTPWEKRPAIEGHHWPKEDQESERCLLRNARPQREHQPSRTQKHARELLRTLGLPQNIIVLACSSGPWRKRRRAHNGHRTEALRTLKLVPALASQLWPRGSFLCILQELILAWPGLRPFTWKELRRTE